MLGAHNTVTLVDTQGDPGHVAGSEGVHESMGGQMEDGCVEDYTNG